MMKKIIAMIVLFTIMTGCGKTARLERLEREREAQIAAEQARIEAARLANRSFLKKSWDHIWTHKLGYGLGALVAAGTYYLVSHFPKPKQQEAIPQGNNNPEGGNIHQPNLGADAHQAQNPQQNLEIANNAAIPQQDLELTAEEEMRLYIEQPLITQQRWLSGDSQLRMAQKIEGRQQLTHSQQLCVDAYNALLDAESRITSSPYAYDSAHHIILIHRWNIAFVQWRATHLTNIGYTTPKPKKMPTLIAR